MKRSIPLAVAVSLACASPQNPGVARAPPDTLDARHILIAYHDTTEAARLDPERRRDRSVLCVIAYENGRVRRTYSRDMTLARCEPLPTKIDSNTVRLLTDELGAAAYGLPAGGDTARALELFYK